MKPGYQTSEWWTTIAAHVIAVLALFHVTVANNLAQALTGLAAAIGPEIGAAFYAHARAKVKQAVIAKAVVPVVTVTGGNAATAAPPAAPIP